MSKFPFGSIIQDEDGDKRKVLGECGEIRFVSSIGMYDELGFSHSVADLERLGYTEVQAPWKPEHGKEYAYLAVNSRGAYKETEDWTDHPVDEQRLSCGNVYNPDDDSCDRAVERVNKALKGE